MGSTQSSIPGNQGSCDGQQTGDTPKYQEDSGATENIKRENLNDINAELSVVQKQINQGLASKEDRIREIARIRRARKTERREIRQKTEDYLKCPICSNVMFNPYTLHLCGDSICAPCLLEAFKAQKKTHDKNDTGLWDTERVINKLNEDMEGKQELLSGRQQMTTVFHPSFFMRPIYTCPECEEPVCTRPIPNFSLKSVVTAFYCDSPVPEPTIWDPYFPRPFAYDKIENLS